MMMTIKKGTNGGASVHNSAASGESNSGRLQLQMMMITRVMMLATVMMMTSVMMICNQCEFASHLKRHLITHRDSGEKSNKWSHHKVAHKPFEEAKQTIAQP